MRHPSSPAASLAASLAANLAAITLALAALAAFAQTPPPSPKEAVPTAQDPVTAKRATELAGKLRCLVCQNQTIADSNADLAVDLRGQIAEQLKQGRTDVEIIDYMVARYGDFVLYSPPFKATTVLLWLGPALILALGIAVLFRTVRARRTRPEERPLTEDERRRAARLLAGERGESRGEAK